MLLNILFPFFLIKDFTKYLLLLSLLFYQLNINISNVIKDQFSLSVEFLIF